MKAMSSPSPVARGDNETSEILLGVRFTEFPGAVSGERAPLIRRCPRSSRWFEDARDVTGLKVRGLSKVLRVRKDGEGERMRLPACREQYWMCDSGCTFTSSPPTGMARALHSSEARARQLSALHRPRSTPPPSPQGAWCTRERERTGALGASFQRSGSRRGGERGPKG